MKNLEAALAAQIGNSLVSLLPHGESSKTKLLSFHAAVQGVETLQAVAARMESEKTCGI